MMLPAVICTVPVTGQLSSLAHNVGGKKKNSVLGKEKKVF